MNTTKAIKQQTQAIIRLERNLALQKIKQRKADTRQKIQLGGLVTKAGMHQHTKAVILGALIDALEQMGTEPTTKKIFQAKGEAAFMGYDKN